MKLYCYAMPPIDIWAGAMTGEELLKSLWGRFPNEWTSIGVVCRELHNLAMTAQEAFEKIGWEGDIAGGPYYFAVPFEVELRVGFMIKQSNNGSCFVASPIPLPHLEENAFENSVIG